MIEKLLFDLKKYMLENNINQSEVALILGIKQPQISRLFSRTREPSAKLVRKIEGLLNGN